jgi:ribosomal protein S6--L-glutamate ligase
VIGGEVVASMQRTAKQGDFRANLHRGGTAVEVEITAEERRTALRAAKVMGLNVAGVDLMRSGRGPVVLEVNSTPGLEGIEFATRKDIAGMIVAFVERDAAKRLEGAEGRT